jgi:type VI secretion system ImpC/EvpB family protein
MRPSAIMVRDFKNAIEFDQSALFKKVYEEEFGTFGGAPFGTIIGDFEVTRQPEDVYFVEQMAHVAAAAHAPFIASASPELLGLESFADLGKPRDLGKMFDTRRIRQVEVVPRFGRLALCRPDAAALSWAACRSIRKMARPLRRISSKTWTAPTTAKYLWCNAAYGLSLRA